MMLLGIIVKNEEHFKMDDVDDVFDTGTFTYDVHTEPQKQTRVLIG